MACSCTLTWKLRDRRNDRNACGQMCRKAGARWSMSALMERYQMHSNYNVWREREGLDSLCGRALYWISLRLCTAEQKDCCSLRTQRFTSYLTWTEESFENVCESEELVPCNNTHSVRTSSDPSTLTQGFLDSPQTMNEWVQYCYWKIRS